MKKITNALALPYILLIFVSAIIFLLNFYYFDKLDNPADDDYLYSHALTQGRSLWQITWDHYQTWSGRSLISVITVLTINHMWLWRLLNTGMFFLIAFSFSVLIVPARSDTWCNRDNFWFIFVLALCCILTLNNGVFYWSIAWVVGSYNYLWPSALAAYSMLHFAKDGFATEQPFLRWQRISFILAGVYAAYSEQSALVLATMALMMCCYRRYKKRLSHWHLFHLVMVLINVGILFAAPGNMARYWISVEIYFPEFGQLSLIQRLGLGSELLLASAYSFNIALTGIALILPFLILQKNQSRLTKVLVCCSCAWMIYANVCPITNFYLPKLMSLLIVGAGIWAVYLHQALSRWMIAVAFFAGIAATLVIGFSPSIYESGDRTLFVSNLLFSFVFLNLFYELLHHSGWIRSTVWIHRSYAYACVLLILLALYRIQNLISYLLARNS